MTKSKTKEYVANRMLFDGVTNEYVAPGEVIELDEVRAKILLDMGAVSQLTSQQKAAGDAPPSETEE